MGKNINQIWFEDLLCEERLTGTERLWRNICRIADGLYLVVTLEKYPLTSNKQSYTIKVHKKDEASKWNLILFEQSGMELEPILSKVLKDLVNYRDENKEYQLQKPGGGELI